ncbi:unnamed protein product [Dovyalis caffra]|uniref:Uncharacterized protein n=1 Tax=Dovyalis caffra TaxID=77055 RepID=A0AAV1RN02_9ROSI|nr:unnamed protein product [Dovyalis caffra]
MTTSSSEEKWELSDRSNPEEEGEEEEEGEALSLCDLPVNMVKEENSQSRGDPEAHQEAETNQEDFDFDPCRGGYGSLSNKSDMCAADDIFFQGQILPLRLSVSSESGVNKFKNDSSLNPSQSPSRSESMDHNSLGGFTSFSSRSSSSRSHYSSSSSSTNTAIASTRLIKPIIENQFLTHPSPKPLIRLSSTSLGNIAASNRPRNSSVWDFFRLGLVRTPEIELQDLKVRNSVSMNSSSSIRNSNTIIKKSSKIKVSSDSSKSGRKMKNVSSDSIGKKMEEQSLLEKRGGLLSGCSCSVSAVKPVPLNNIVVVKSSKSTSSTRSAGNDNNDKSKRGPIELEEKLHELKMKERMVQKHQQQQGKQAMSSHRTFEWIKELSHATYLDHEEEAIKTLF